MKLWSISRCLLPVLAILGILIAPVAASAGLGMAEHTSMTGTADDMPCCPRENPAMPDCSKACPLMAVCTAKCFQNVSTAPATALLPVRAAGLLVPADDAPWACLAQAPPLRPPRS